MSNHFEKRHGRQGLKLIIAEARISDIERELRDARKLIKRIGKVKFGFIIDEARLYLEKYRKSEAE